MISNGQNGLVMALISGLVAGCGDSVGVDGDSGARPDVLSSDGVVDPTCGDGVIGEGEECDAPDLPATRCEELGLGYGPLTCSAECRLDTSACGLLCGDGIRDPGEVCDGVALGGQTCEGLGFEAGTLTCRTDCNYDLSACAGGCGNGVVEGSEECDDGNAVDWDGCTDCRITEFLVNTTTSRDQEFPAVDMAADGRFLVAWSSYGQDGDGDGVYAQWFDTLGNRIGGERQINDYTIDNQDFPDVAMSPSGSSVVLWTSIGQDSGTPHAGGVFGQRFDSTGAPLGAEFQVNTYTMGGQELGRADLVDSGRFVAVWLSTPWQDGDDYGVFGQPFDAQGSPVGAELQLNTYFQGEQSIPTVAMAADGSFVAVWSSEGQNGCTLGIFGQRFTADGNAVGAEFQISDCTVGAQYEADIAMRPTGEFVVVWQRETIFDNFVLARLYDAQGNPMGPEIEAFVEPKDYYHEPAVAVASTGDFIIAWHHDDQDFFGIFVKRFDAAGALVGVELQANDYVTDQQVFPDVAMNADGSFVVVWQSSEQDGSGTGIYAQRFDAQGNKLGVGN